MIGCFFQFVVQSSWFSPRFVCACRQKVRCQFHQHLFNGQKWGGVFPFLFAGLRDDSALFGFSTHHPEYANKMRQLAALVRFPDTTTKAKIIKEFHQLHIKLTAVGFQRRTEHLHLQFIYKPLENKVSKGTSCVWMWNNGCTLYSLSRKTRRWTLLHWPRSASATGVHGGSLWKRTDFISLERGQWLKMKITFTRAFFPTIVVSLSQTLTNVLLNGLPWQRLPSLSAWVWRPAWV